MRIAVLTSRDWVNSNYRAFPLVSLRMRGHEVRLEWDADKRLPDGLHRCDVVHAYRLNTPASRKLLAQVRERGVGIVWDDDDFAGLPTLRGDAVRSQSFRAEASRMLKIAHVATTPSEVLAGHFREWGAEHVRVVENYLPGTYAPPRAAASANGGETLTIGWIAAAEHVYDLEQLGITDTLKRLMAAHPQVRFESVGVNLRLPPERYRHLYRLQYADLAERVATWDIGIAPLADITFNRAKSNVKLKEYAAAGVPWLASPIGPYEGFGEKQGGRLVPDDGWYEALERLVVREKDRRKLVKRGLRWARTQTVQANLDAWEGAMSQAAELARA
jgi:glycosyltransferase involved in cell wall biosynthesis